MDFCDVFTTLYLYVFGGKYFKDKNNKIGCNLIFISVVLFIFAIIQALLGTYGA